ncbi:MAG: hypothetical protein Pg6A_20180 [Termitinemataceae bacterium]|nr:MAG: hypothetical protein Pg6A_20180 [Termitinemataceae bacterium]
MAYHRIRKGGSFIVLDSETGEEIPYVASDWKTGVYTGSGSSTPVVESSAKVAKEKPPKPQKLTKEEKKQRNTIIAAARNKFEGGDVSHIMNRNAVGVIPGLQYGASFVGPNAYKGGDPAKGMKSSAEMLEEARKGADQLNLSYARDPEEEKKKHRKHIYYDGEGADADNIANAVKNDSVAMHDLLLKMNDARKRGKKIFITSKNRKAAKEEEFQSAQELNRLAAENQRRVSNLQAKAYANEWARKGKGSWSENARAAGVPKEEIDEVRAILNADASLRAYEDYRATGKYEPFKGYEVTGDTFKPIPHNIKR